MINVLAAGSRDEKPFVVTTEEYSKAPPRKKELTLRPLVKLWNTFPILPPPGF